MDCNGRDGATFLLLRSVRSLVFVHPPDIPNPGSPLPGFLLFTVDRGARRASKGKYPSVRPSVRAAHDSASLWPVLHEHWLTHCPGARPPKETPPFGGLARILKCLMGKQFGRPRRATPPGRHRLRAWRPRKPTPTGSPISRMAFLGDGGQGPPTHYGLGGHFLATWLGFPLRSMPRRTQWWTVGKNIAFFAI